MKLLVFCVLAAATGCNQVAMADTTSDSEQDNAYVHCLIKRRVNLPEIPKEDSEFCMRTAGVPDPGDEARKSKGKDWSECLVGNIVQLDDGVSPAKDIGQAVIGLCAAEWHGYVSAFWMNPGAKRKMANGVEKYAASEGVRAVLAVRWEKSKK